MKRYERAFRITVWTGVIVNLALAAAALVAPDWFLTAWGFDVAYPNLWPRFAAWLVILLSLMYIPGANDIHRYRANAVLQVVARFGTAAFFTGAVLVLGFSTRFLLFGLLDLAFAVPSGVFLWLALRRQEQQKTPIQPRTREPQHVADEAPVAQTL
ncbi:MAG TPA: hypothetical protein VHG08_27825 [Longimicrobium sp.]|nr:hypothetical protein [Longimicrobium sp.]